jgi:DNA (cytosine-5)-methyltransferase 1
MKKTVVELFAGVGGFRVGLNLVETIDVNGRAIESGNWEFVWANQWEPSTKIQPAFDCYQTRFGHENHHVNIDISTIKTSDIPNHTLLVGGFPCQDYSVARSLSKEKGIQGKKGVLWWEIHRILSDKKPPFILLENVDRLLKSPSKQRGRDYGIMLRSLNDLGYGIEWRIINAADYGGSQKRKRVFIFGFHHTTLFYNKISNIESHLLKVGLFAKTFPVKEQLTKMYSHLFDITKDLVDVSNTFNFNFENTGICINGVIYTMKTDPIKESFISLKTIIEKNQVESSYFFSEEQIKKQLYLKSSKRIERIKPNGEPYFYSEGSMAFPDDLNSAGRTMLTSEGTINRSSHIIEDFKTKKLRKLTPIEAERLNHFPDNWTNTMQTRHRYFMMGNALVTLLVKKISLTLDDILNYEKKES